MAMMDSGVLPGSTEAIVDGALSTTAEILMLPGMLIYDLLPVRLRHDIVEWSLLVATSLIWGFSALYLWRRFHRRGGKNNSSNWVAGGF